MKPRRSQRKHRPPTVDQVTDSLLPQVIGLLRAAGKSLLVDPAHEANAQHVAAAYREAIAAREGLLMLRRPEAER